MLNFLALLLFHSEFTKGSKNQRTSYSIHSMVYYSSLYYNCQVQVLYLPVKMVGRVFSVSLPILHQTSSPSPPTQPKTDSHALCTAQVPYLSSSYRSHTRVATGRRPSPQVEFPTSTPRHSAHTES